MVGARVGGVSMSLTGVPVAVPQCPPPLSYPEHFSSLCSNTHVSPSGVGLCSTLGEPLQQVPPNLRTLRHPLAALFLN